MATLPPRIGVLSWLSSGRSDRAETARDLRQGANLLVFFGRSAGDHRAWFYNHEADAVAARDQRIVQRRNVTLLSLGIAFWLTRIGIGPAKIAGPAKMVEPRRTEIGNGTLFRRFTDQPGIVRVRSNIGEIVSRADEHFEVAVVLGSGIGKVRIAIVQAKSIDVEHDDRFVIRHRGFFQAESDGLGLTPGHPIERHKARVLDLKALAFGANETARSLNIAKHEKKRLGGKVVGEAPNRMGKDRLAMSLQLIFRNRKTRIGEAPAFSSHRDYEHCRSISRNISHKGGTHWQGTPTAARNYHCVGAASTKRAERKSRQPLDASARRIYRLSQRTGFRIPGTRLRWRPRNARNSRRRGKAKSNPPR